MTVKALKDRIITLKGWKEHMLAADPSLGSGLRLEVTVTAPTLADAQKAADASHYLNPSFLFTEEAGDQQPLTRTVQHQDGSVLQRRFQYLAKHPLVAKKWEKQQQLRFCTSSQTTLERFPAIRNGFVLKVQCQILHCGVPSNKNKDLCKTKVLKYLAILMVKMESLQVWKKGQSCSPLCQARWTTSGIVASRVPGVAPHPPHPFCNLWRAAIDRHQRQILARITCPSCRWLSLAWSPLAQSSAAPYAPAA